MLLTSNQRLQAQQLVAMGCQNGAARFATHVIHASRQRAQRLQRQLDEACAAAQQAEVQAQDLRSGGEVLTTRLRDCEGALAAVQLAYQQLEESAAAERGQLATQLADQREALAVERGRAAAFEHSAAEVVPLAQEVAQLRASCTDAADQLAGTETRLAATQSALTEAEAHAAAATAEAGALLAARDMAQQQVRELEQQLAETAEALDMQAALLEEREEQLQESTQQAQVCVCMRVLPISHARMGREGARFSSINALQRGLAVATVCW